MLDEYKYAQIAFYDDEKQNGTAVGISFLSGRVNYPHMIHLDGTHEKDDAVDLGWRWIDGKWAEPEVKPVIA